ncbi:hypothetical protein [Nocardioides sp. cx-173]|uniref:hypothetical protein n=1 Tax=Nocardioides sp. cx-173 TaxID=2898796 RepID=UPI001E3E65A3|nr:hypothetical protein [Nocardioides sp. cx-173]MCD4525395.1 hypothetical protein [Nocardioides sp. cx-173]UGB40809.1 hypothetical protein LQ940_15685 [Nocardioides sp. cx-173]
MTTPSARAERGRSIAMVAIAALAVAALVLAVLVWRANAGDASETADVGEMVPLETDPYGRAITVRLPGTDLTFVVGAPVDVVAHEMLDVEYDDPRWEDGQDLQAPDGGTLVPLGWRFDAPGGLLSDGDPAPIELRLVAGDRTVELDRVDLGHDDVVSYDPRMLAVGVGGDLDVTDLSLEVEYDGLTQTVDVSTGKVDAGVAQALYEQERSLTAGCTEVEDRCALAAADPASSLRPSPPNLTASYVSLYPYDPVLGWADDGTLWAAVRLQILGVSVHNAAGDSWKVRRYSRPSVSLDGAQPVRRDGLEADAHDSYGSVVFRVDADTAPRVLTVEQVLMLSGPGERRLPVVLRRQLAPLG